MYHLKKALYSLNQEPGAWHERLTDFLLNHGYVRKGADMTLFIKQTKREFNVAKIYVDDIVFGGSSWNLVD